MIHIDFKLLVFVSAAKNLNFTRAAKEMNISQPAVSKNIQDLEQQAGRNLFERNGHRLALTEAGHKLLTYALRIQGLYEDLNAELKSLDGILSGELRLGASTTLSHFILPEILAEFHLAFPNIGLQVYHGNTHAVEDWLLDKTIDLGLVEGLSDHISMKYETFLKDEVVLVTRQNNPKVKGKESISTNDLLGLEYVFREQGSGTIDIIRRGLHHAGIDWQKLYVKVHLASTESIKNFLLKTDCFSFLSIHAIAKEVQQGDLRVIDVDGFSMERNFYFVHPYGVIGQVPEAFRRFAFQQFEKNGIFTRASIQS